MYNHLFMVGRLMWPGHKHCTNSQILIQSQANARIVLLRVVMLIIIQICDKNLLCIFS